MRVGEKSVQRRVALALAHLCSPDDQKTVFIDNNGILLMKFFSNVSVMFPALPFRLCSIHNWASHLPHVPYCFLQD